MTVEAIGNKNIINNSTQNEINSTAIKTEPYPQDSVELSIYSDNKKKLTNTQKTLIGIGTVLTTFITAVALFVRHEGNKIEKLYKEKLILSNLPEKIEFVKAKTVEEGIKFAKEVLGIKEVDKSFTLEAINTANKGLIDVANANRGKVFMPTKLRFIKPKSKNDTYLAYVVKDIYSPEFGNLVINKNYYENNVLESNIKNLLYYTDKTPIYKIDAVTKDIISSYRIGSVRPFPNNELADLIERFYKDSNALNISEKQTLFYSLRYGYDSAGKTFRNPIESIKKISEMYADILKQNNIEVDINKVKNLSTKEQQEYLTDIVDKLEDKKQFWNVQLNIEDPAYTIHHEMGHLQDYAKNLKDLDLKQWRFSWSEAWNDAKNNRHSRAGVKELANRWGSNWKEYYEKLLIENPEKFKKLYPDFYEFSTNQQIQQTAGKVSRYAQAGIGEFIAEVYARMIEGKEIPDDVLTLYMKYNGPVLSVAV